MEEARRAVMLKIFEACQRLHLPISTTITALTTAHRFIKFISLEMFLQKSEKVQVAAICFLSCKLDEHTRTLRDVICVIRELYRRDAARSVSNAQVSVDKDPKVELFKEEMEYPAIREVVVAEEQVLLRVTGFETKIEIPHKYLLNMSRALCLSCPVVQYAYALLNDCFLHHQCVDMEPLALAAACLYLGIHVMCQSTPVDEELSHTITISHETLKLLSERGEGFDTTKVCLKPPTHDLHSVLKEKWWSKYFEIEDNTFWSAVKFTTMANS